MEQQCIELKAGMMDSRPMLSLVDQAMMQMAIKQEELLKQALQMVLGDDADLEYFKEFGRKEILANRAEVYYLDNIPILKFVQGNLIDLCPMAFERKASVSFDYEFFPGRETSDKP